MKIDSFFNLRPHIKNSKGDKIKNEGRINVNPPNLPFWNFGILTFIKNLLMVIRI